MIILTEPNEKYLASYVEAYNEYENHHLSAPFHDAKSCDLFAKYDHYKNERNLPPDRVGAHYFWLVDDGRDLFIGEISIRHRLTDALLRYGGHIGYGVRYSAWNQGYGTLMLRLALEKAKQMGFSKVLITCDDDNLASAKVMEKNAMLLHDKVENMIGGQKIITRRYWKVL